MSTRLGVISAHVPCLQRGAGYPASDVGATEK